MAIDDEVQARLEAQDAINDALTDRHNFFMKLVTGRRDDEDSFDEEGRPSTDPEHGDLGFYPVFNQAGQTVYRPCLDRIRADGDTGAMPMSIFGDEVTAYSTVSMVKLEKYIGRLGGESGTYVLAPVTEGSEAIRLTHQSSMTIPFNGKARAMIFANLESDAVRVNIGAANSPLPQPVYPVPPLDLGGGGNIFGPLGEVTPLGIQLGPVEATEFNISIEDGLDLVVMVPSTVYDQVSFGWDFSVESNISTLEDGPWAITGDGLPATIYLNAAAPEDMTWDVDNYPTLATGTGFSSPALGLQFEVTADPITSMAPPRFQVDIDAICPLAEVLLLYLSDLSNHAFVCYATVGGFKATCYSPAGSQTKFMAATRDYDNRHVYSFEFVNDLEGEGGTVNVYEDGVLAATDDFDFKATISENSQLFINNAFGNYSASTAGTKLFTYNFTYDIPRIVYDYVPFSDVTISAEDIVRLGADARDLLVDQPAREVSYSVDAGPTSTLTVTLGETIYPAYVAYKAVLITYDEDGEEVPHPNELVMTKFRVQNARFEDELLFSQQPPWSECIPEGDPPVIDGIVYTCNATRIGNYCCMQFGYHISEDVNPIEPFGDLNNLNDGDGIDTTMVPHKWFIYDAYGHLLHRVEQPNGDALNRNFDTPYFQGPWTQILTGRPAAHTSAANPYFPSGVTGSSVIWASHDLEDHDRDFVKSQIMMPRELIKYSCHTDSAVNGFDMRYSTGGLGGGQFNGWANCRIQPWEPTDYDTYVADAGNTLSPYTNLDTALSRGTNAVLHMQYTPFNIMGRSPITGPGGVRDDRQAIAEPVCWYLVEPEGTRPHDNTPYRDMAIDYLRGYASDPFHLFEDGFCDPLYKLNLSRYIGFIGHYYGGGDLGLPENGRYYLYLNRSSNLLQANPMRLNPGNGFTSEKHYRNNFGIDLPHGHQFPGWGSLMFKSPEFAFLQAKFFDQSRMWTVGGPHLPYLDSIWQRDFAWFHLHAAMIWKLGSQNSPRLYTRQQVIEWICVGMENYYDNFVNSTPGFLNPPEAGQTSAFDPATMALFNFVARFGECHYTDGHLATHNFFRGYWIQALAHGEKLGFHDAIREYSEKAGACLDWLISIYRRAITETLSMPTGPKGYFGYIDVFIPAEDIAFIFSGSAGDPMPVLDDLPITWADIQTTYGGYTTWDHNDDGNYSQDGSGMDCTLAAPTILKYVLGCTGSDIDDAIDVADARIAEKKAQQEGLGASAGSTWFKSLNASNFPIADPEA